MKDRGFRYYLHQVSQPNRIPLHGIMNFIVNLPYAFDICHFVSLPVMSNY